MKKTIMEELDEIVELAKKIEKMAKEMNIVKPEDFIIKESNDASELDETDNEPEE